MGAGAGAAGATAFEGVLPPRDDAKTPVATSGVSPGECPWGRQRHWVRCWTWWQPRTLHSTRGSHCGVPAPPQHPQEQLHQEEQVDAPQHRQPLQHRGPWLCRRLLVLPLRLDTGDPAAQRTWMPRSPSGASCHLRPTGAAVPTWGQRWSRASPQSVPTASATRKANSEWKKLRLSSGTRRTARAEGRLMKVTARSPQPSAARWVRRARPGQEGAGPRGGGPWGCRDGDLGTGDVG